MIWVELFNVKSGSGSGFQTNLKGGTMNNVSLMNYQTATNLNKEILFLQYFHSCFI